MMSVWVATYLGDSIPGICVPATGSGVLVSTTTSAAALNLAGSNRLAPRVDPTDSENISMISPSLMRRLACITRPVALIDTETGPGGLSIQAFLNPNHIIFFNYIG